MLEIQKLQAARDVNKKLKLEWKKEKKVARRLETLIRQLASLIRATFTLMFSTSGKGICRLLSIALSNY